MTVNESITELRVICQVGAHGASGKPWTFMQIRRISIYLTRILLHLPLHPNHITLLGIAVGVLASLLLGLNHLIAGVVTLQFAILLDFCDGEVSRYRKQQSKEGSYLDKVYHFVIQPSAFAGATLAAYRARPSIWIIAVGFVCTISAFVYVMVMAYATELAIWQHCNRLMSRVKRTVEAHPGRGNPSGSLEAELTRAMRPGATPKMEAARNSFLARSVFALSGKWDFPYTLLAISLAVIAQVFVPVIEFGSIRFTPLEAMLLFYAVTYAFWVGFFVFYVLATKSIERGYQAFASDVSLLVSRASAANAVDAGSIR